MAKIIKRGAIKESNKTDSGNTISNGVCLFVLPLRKQLDRKEHDRRKDQHNG